LQFAISSDKPQLTLKDSQYINRNEKRANLLSFSQYSVLICMLLALWIFSSLVSSCTDGRGWCLSNVCCFCFRRRWSAASADECISCYDVLFLAVVNDKVDIMFVDVDVFKKILVCEEDDCFCWGAVYWYYIVHIYTRRDNILYCGCQSRKIILFS